MPRELAMGRLGRRAMSGVWDRVGPPRHCGHVAEPLGPAPWGSNIVYICYRCCATWSVPPEPRDGYDGGLGF